MGVSIAFSSNERDFLDDITLGDVLPEELCTPSLLRFLNAARDNGVLFLLAEAVSSFSLGTGSAPVMVKSTSSRGSGIGCHGIRCRDRVDFTTSPSLSSLKLSFGIDAVTLRDLSRWDAAGSTGFGVFVTRAVVDATFVRFGRGILAVGWCKNADQ